jgi:hypothetical protein
MQLQSDLKSNPGNDQLKTGLEKIENEIIAKPNLAVAKKKKDHFEEEKTSQENTYTKSIFNKTKKSYMIINKAAVKRLGYIAESLDIGSGYLQIMLIIYYLIRWVRGAGKYYKRWYILINIENINKLDLTVYKTAG